MVLASACGAQSLSFSTSAGGNNYDWGTAVAASPDGSIIAAGYFHDTATFGDVSLTSVGFDCYLAKYAVDGEVVWARRVGGPMDDYCSSIATDAEGNIYLAASIAGTWSFGDSTIVDSSAADGVLLKFDPEGSPMWLLRFDGEVEAGISAVSCSQDHLYMTGSFTDTCSIGGAALATAGDKDVFVARCDTTGLVDWAWSFGGDTTDMGQALAANEAGVFVTGYFNDTASFGDSTFRSHTGRDAFVMRLGPDGSFQWARQVQSGGHDLAFGIAAADDGTTYTVAQLLGYCSIESLNFGPYNDYFILKLDPAGGFVWGRVDNAVSGDYSDIAISPSGRLFICGRFNQHADFPPFEISTPEPFLPQGFFALLDQQGSVQWIRQTTGTGDCMPMDCTISSDGTLLVTGQYGGEETFIDTTLVGPGMNDIFLLGLHEVEAGIDEALLNERVDGVTLFPDPFGDQLNVAIDGTHDLRQWRLTDLQGRMIAQGHVKGHILTIRPRIHDAQPCVLLVEGPNERVVRSVLCMGD